MCVSVCVCVRVCVCMHVCLLLLHAVVIVGLYLYIYASCYYYFMTLIPCFLFSHDSLCTLMQKWPSKEYILFIIVIIHDIS